MKLLSETEDSPAAGESFPSGLVPYLATGYMVMSVLLGSSAELGATLTALVAVLLVGYVINRYAPDSRGAKLALGFASIIVGGLLPYVA